MYRASFFGISQDNLSEKLIGNETKIGAITFPRSQNGQSRVRHTSVHHQFLAPSYNTPFHILELKTTIGALGTNMFCQHLQITWVTWEKSTTDVPHKLVCQFMQKGLTFSIRGHESHGQFLARLLNQVPVNRNRQKYYTC